MRSWIQYFEDTRGGEIGKAVTGVDISLDQRELLRPSIVEVEDKLVGSTNRSPPFDVQLHTVYCITKAITPLLDYGD
jgi:hypothetical protein